MMKKALLFVLVILSLVAGLAFTPGSRASSYYAATATPTEAPSATPTLAPTATSAPTLEPTQTPAAVTPVDLRSGNDVIQFIQVPVQDTVMHGPYDLMRVRFGLPVDWKPLPGAELQLVVNPTFNTNRRYANGALAHTGGATIQVTYNNKVIDTIGLSQSGEQTVVIPIPQDALETVRRDRRHELILFLDASEDCEFSDTTSVIIKSTSRFFIPHENVTPEINFADLPYPFYQSGQFLTFEQIAARTNGIPFDSTTILVVPDQPDAAEIQAALTTSAALGNMSSSNLITTLVTESSLTADMRAAKDIIYIGKGASFPSLASLTLPAPASGDTFAGLGSPEDGVLQMIPSPWNPARVMMVVSGASNSAVVSAAQGLSSGAFLTAGRPDLVIVKAIQAEQPVSDVPVDRTFAGLGHRNITLSGVGTVSTDIIFFIPPGQTTNEDAYVQIQFSNAASINTNSSTLNLFINDQPIGGSRIFTDEENVNIFKAKIPASTLKPNVNVLTIEADLLGIDTCLNYTSTQLWTSISSDSLLHIPLVNATISRNQFFNLGAYPYTFNDHPDLKETSFIVTANDPTAWNTASLIASDLGRRITGGIVEFTAYYADAVPDAVRQSNNLLIIGRASRIPLLQDLKDSLPAAFEPGSDLASEKNLRVAFRLPDNTSLGYLELLVSPWNANRTILAILGTSDEGLDWAGKALTTSTLRSSLAGNFAVIKADEILTAETRNSMMSGSLSATAVMGAAADLEAMPVSTSAPVTGIAAFSASKEWIPPVIGAAVLLMILILVIGLRSARSQND